MDALHLSEPVCAALASSNFSLDPKYSNRGGDDYHILAGSPVIDLGSPHGAPARDFDGQCRPFDGDSDGTAIVDIGADEPYVRSQCGLSTICP
jgi:hypothetical protein